MLSPLYCFVVKVKLIAKSLPPVALEYQDPRIFIPMPIGASGGSVLRSLLWGLCPGGYLSREGVSVWRVSFWMVSV